VKNEQTTKKFFLTKKQKLVFCSFFPTILNLTSKKLKICEKRTNIGKTEKEMGKNQLKKN
jgi:hypothetical protein